MTSTAIPHAIKQTTFPAVMAGESPREEDDSYRAVVAVLSSDFRVIKCRDGIQWILQRRAGKRHGQTRWDGRCYCRTRQGLMLRVRGLAGEIDPIALGMLGELPDFIGQSSVRAHQ